VALVNHSTVRLSAIEKEIVICLQDKRISAVLHVEIKNQFENLRSVLDYCAHKIFTQFCHSSNPKHRIYFPYADKNKSLKSFRIEGRIEKIFPGLSAQRSI
jgi:hypothetical protein